MPRHPKRTALLVVSLLASALASASGDGGSCPEGGDDGLASRDAPPPPESCRLFLAPRDDRSNDAAEGGGRRLGLFAAADFPRGTPVTPRGGDVVLHLIDVDAHLDDEKTQLAKWLSRGYLRDAATSGHGGNYEGLGGVLTALPGVGMLASSPVRSYGRPNVWASVPESDEAGLPRGVSPLAGSFSLHYNLTHVVSHPEGIARGGEVLVDRDGWHRRKALGNSTTSKEEEGSSEPISTDNRKLFEEGICVDNLYYGTSAHGYGRGGFASRSLRKGSIVAPVPVLPIPRKELRYLRSKERKEVGAHRRKLRKEDPRPAESEADEALPSGMEWRQQLMLNYCYGHRDSSVLLFPYGLVNQINHARSSSDDEESGGPVANVGLRWSERLMKNDEDVDPRTMTPAQLWERPSPEGLVLEMVALRDIQPDEEVLLDYGPLWTEAWESHTKAWNEDPEDDYSPAYIMEDVVSNLRTAEEQLSYPYPDNVFTACFYRYERDENKTEQGQKSPAATKQTEAIPWKMSAGLFDMMNLRPCKVISREPAVNKYASQQEEEQQRQQPGKGKMFYTAIIQNRPGLPANERVPKGEKHVVSGIPREAFRFVDRPYTSDVHLDGAFRHNIGLEGTGIYPGRWLDIV